MGLRFIFMLTRNDRTVEDAAAHLDIALRLGLRHIGFKDIGLPISDLKALARTIREGGATSYLEVVSLDRESEVASARAAVEIGVDVLLGGTRVEDVLPVLAGSGLNYCPFPGQITGHPSVLEGSVEEIADSARLLAAREGVHGLDLLAYRARCDVPALMQAVCAVTDKPVIMAGSIDTPDRIAAVKAAGAAGFTIGTAALDGRYPDAPQDLEGQLAAIIGEVARLNDHLSPVTKTNLDEAFGRTPGAVDLLAGQVNEMQVRLTRIEGAQRWHFRTTEDEMFFVHRGRLLMRFRDRDEVVEEGEFIVVPHGVEHCPVALDGPCDVLLMAPGATAGR
ncbi:cupin domain-containing protein [Oceanicola sp. S124]|uniref:cupin domain-containing protein n=1 Tax=Oceanicola sp. S124 TaxID=1042378 RepID=UPI0002559985|nr:cupin domain-containing protein [Oceanicola sp. S124]